jgi:3alpha(or 20beta)-hydroxysteroid dehydrogenase
LDGKRILVTGAARGVGAEIARQAAAAGARVMLTDVRDEQGYAVADSIGSAADYEHLDVSEDDDWHRVAAITEDRLGGLEGLVNNAAVLHMAPLEEIPLEEAHRVIDVNLFGVFLGIRSCVPLMRTGRGGSIVNIDSIDGLHGMNSIAVYSASKWAVRGLTRSAAIELGRRGIRVNTVCPSRGNPDMYAPFASLMDMARYEQSAPPYKLAVGETPYEVGPADVARMTLFLLSDDSAGCTGADFVVDAGFTAGPYCDGLPGS